MWTTTDSNSYHIKLPEFQGPFDLLLFFIERDELDIHDIPIAKITADFLGYIQAKQALNIELASEFILVAASLMRIKVRMLLPRKLDEQGQLEPDPRAELSQKLLEYQAYKQAFQFLEQAQDQQQQRHNRGLALEENLQLQEQYLHEAELENLSLFQILKAYVQVLEKQADRQKIPSPHRIAELPYTLEQSRHFIMQFFKTKKQAQFEDLFQHCYNRLQAVFQFLALLELIQQGQILLEQVGDAFNQFQLRAAPAPNS